MGFKGFDHGRLCRVGVCIRHVAILLTRRRLALPQRRVKAPLPLSADALLAPSACALARSAEQPSRQGS